MGKTHKHTTNPRICFQGPSDMLLVFFSGAPLWSTDVVDAAPLFTWENRTGVVTATYDPTLKKYLMVVSTTSWGDGSVLRHPNGTQCCGGTIGPFDTYILESDSITGPYRLVVCQETQAIPTTS